MAENDELDEEGRVSDGTVRSVLVSMGSELLDDATRSLWDSS